MSREKWKPAKSVAFSGIWIWFDVLSYSREHEFNNDYRPTTFASVEDALNNLKELYGSGLSISGRRWNHLAGCWRHDITGPSMPPWAIVPFHINQYLPAEAMQQQCSRGGNTLYRPIPS